jgi:protease I
MQRNKKHVELPEIGLISLALALVTGAGHAQGPATDSSQNPARSILVLIAQKDFDYGEYHNTTACLRELGDEVVTVSADTVLASAMNDSTVKPDLALKMVAPERYQALIVVGGIGSVLFWQDSLVLQFVRNFALKKAHVVGAIGLGPITLAKTGVLKGRTVTVYNDAKAATLVEDGGARIQFRDVVTDGNIVTATGGEAGRRFAEAVDRQLKKPR